MKRISGPVFLLALPSACATSGGIDACQTVRCPGAPINPNDIPASDNQYTHILKADGAMCGGALHEQEQAAEPPP
jgi:hypothetical protein